MKLKNFRRVAALGMAVGMTAVLAACGNTADTTASSEAAESTAETADTTEKASAETADAEYAYLADFSFSDAFDENGYLKGVTATDYVTLPDDYADITISADLGQVSDDDINDYIDSNVLSNFATTNEVKDRAAADGDTVNIDYVGRIDSVAFDGGDTKGSGADLTLGSGTYIDSPVRPHIMNEPSCFIMRWLFRIGVTNTCPVMSDFLIRGSNAGFLDLTSLASFPASS